MQNISYCPCCKTYTHIELISSIISYHNEEKLKNVQKTTTDIFLCTKCNKVQTSTIEHKRHY